MKSLTGRYRLKSHGVFSVDGSFTPTSDYLNGELIYGIDGSLSVLIIFKKDPQNVNDVYGYLGTYKVVSESKIEHHFTVATEPSQVNSREERVYSLNHDELRLGKNWEDGRRFEAVWIKN